MHFKHIFPINLAGTLASVTATRSSEVKLGRKKKSGAQLTKFQCFLSGKSCSTGHCSLTASETNPIFSLLQK